MSESDAVLTQADLKALEALQADASELEFIETLLDRFNIFEAIGVVGQEVRHSRFLAFLLDPYQKHGLGDLFFKRLLRKVLDSSGTAPFPSLLENLDKLDLSQTQVNTERYNIDILLTNKAHVLAVIVENKLWSTEHSDQLNRYYGIVRKNYPRWHVAGIYLTPHGSSPSHEAYLSLSYTAVCEIVDGILETRGSTVSPDVRISLEHYLLMLRRHIVDDPKIVSLCKDMYQRHRRAFDLVYKYRPDAQAELLTFLERLVEQELEFELDESSKSRVRFVAQDWDTPALRKGSNWTSSGRILLFEFWNESVSLDLKLMIGPGEAEPRQKLLDMARVNLEVFRLPQKSDFKHGAIFSRPFLRKGMYEGHITQAEREEEIRRHWDEFLDKDLPRIEEALRGEAWIWEPLETDEPQHH